MNGIDFLADTNILIYTLEGHPGVKSILPYSFALSVISEIELLGKTGILEEEIEAIRDLLNDCTLIELSETIKTRAIQLKQKQKIRLPSLPLQPLNFPYRLLLRTSAWKKLKA